MTRKLALITMLSLCSGHALAESEPQVEASIADLAWMTGSWAGPLGDATLEENWIVPRDGSIGALVRMTGAGATSMVELIVIEQTGPSLTLSLQQWDPGMTPRTPRMQKMRLAGIGAERVSFAATEPGGLKGLGYSRPADDTFVVEVLTPDDQQIQINLKAREE